MNNRLSMLKPMSAKQVLSGKRNTFMHREDIFWFAFDATSHGLSQYYEFTDVLKKIWQIDDQTFMNIHIALSESVMNAIDHGNKWMETKSVYICARRDDEFYNFSVEDEGEGFNYRRIKNPTDFENRINTGGRGIFVMNYLSDEMHFSENGRCVKLLFRRKQ